MAPAISKIDEVADKTFDYVIIGGGVAGCTLASRLSENPDVTVLLLEAGKAHIGDPLIDIPTGSRRQHGLPQYDWGFETVPQKNLGGKVIAWNRGKGLGGSSNINYTGWTRPGRVEIDDWERLGNPGWNYDSFIKYIKKAENFQFPTHEIIENERLVVDPEGFGRDGPIAISYCNIATGAAITTWKTMEARGIRNVKNPENGEYSGSWKFPSTVDSSTLTRSSAFIGYILPNLGRGNLFVLAEAYGTRIILGDSKVEPVTAEGVEFLHESKIHRVSAAKEVVVSSGALKSPQILELSGIGDPNILKPLGIDVKVDLPGVGANLQEHTISYTISFELKEDSPIISLDMLSDPAYMQKHTEYYTQKLPGLLSFTGNGTIYLSLQDISENVDEIIAKHERSLANLPPTAPGIAEQLKIQLSHLKNKDMPDCEILPNSFFTGFTNKAAPGKRYISFVSCLVAAWSRGTAHITSTDPLNGPAFDPNYLEHELDLDILTETFKFARSTAEYEPLKSHIAKEMNPGPNISTDEEIKAHLKEHLGTMWHTSATCSMLPRELGGVVDPSLKVYGTSNIRICDLSVIPLLVRVHTQALTYGIAEKAADIIKGSVWSM
ncbi:GMC oxidoreductase [Sphaerobolus stellatus SS14]|uniref:GMC oxidoreductase n=1 Tax=Sphaerobolus stellatus (strain SS14) TaxID=990650 RepID=A0A0C9UU80_SPHS4|nr:GMC oxidoreductase [Sphaerobolus stellatus SS14]